jgi:hypothetical protein
VRFGVSSDRAVAGDWTGTGRDAIGVFRSGTYYLTNDLARPTTDTTVRFGDTADRPLVGDWDGNHTVTLGVQRGY